MKKRCAFLLSILFVFFLISEGHGRDDRKFQQESRGRKQSESRQKTQPLPDSESADAGDLIAKARDLVNEGKYPEALETGERALAMRERKLGPDHPKTAGAAMFLGQTHEDWGQIYRAIQLYGKALQIREKALGPEHQDTLTSKARLGRCYAKAGFFSKAVPLAVQALEARQRTLGVDHPDTADSMGILGMIYAETGSLAQAMPLLQRYLEVQQRVSGPDDLRTAGALDLMARLHSRMGAFDKAVPLAEQSVAITEKAFGADTGQTIAAARIKNLGLLYLSLKDYPRAESCFRRAKYKQGIQGMVELCLATGKYRDALAHLDNLPPGPAARPQYLVQYHVQRGLALKGLGKETEACSAFLDAMKAVEELRSRTPGERTSFFEGGFTTVVPYYRAYRGLIGVLAEMGLKGKSLPKDAKSYGADPAGAAFYFAEAIKGRALLDAIAAGSARLSPQLPPDLAKREKDLEDRLLTLEEKREETFLPHKGRKEHLAAFRAEVESVQKEQQGLLEEVRRKAPRYAAMEYPQPYKPHELPLKAGEVLIEYAVCEGETYLFRVEPGGLTRVFRIPLGQEALEKRLSAFCAPLRQSILRREDLQRFSLAEAASLYRELLEPALAGVSPDTKIIIVPDGVLGAFPFEALAVEAGPDWVKSALVADRWLVTYSQSAAILALNRHLGLSRATQPIFALGDCIYDQDSPRYKAYKAGKAKAGELRHAGPERAVTMSVTESAAGTLEFAPLPETRQLVTELAEMFGVVARPPQVLLDVQATKPAVRETPLSQYRFLFFGTHGFLSEQLSSIQEPVLVLTQAGNKSPVEGFLTFSEVLEMKVDADIVTLAACMTGVGQVMRGEGTLNFARAFLQAGARSVMVTLWNIPVSESMLFYRVFYQNLKEGRSKLQAMQAARKAVRAKEPHPYFWSGIILHGEG